MLSQQRLCKNLQRSCWESTSKMEPLEGGLPAKRCLVSTCSMLVSEVRLRYSGLGMSSMSALERICHSCPSCPTLYPSFPFDSPISTLYLVSKIKKRISVEGLELGGPII